MKTTSLGRERFIQCMCLLSTTNRLDKPKCFSSDSMKRMAVTMVFEIKTGVLTCRGLEMVRDL